jgi:hypothetical protein
MFFSANASKNGDTSMYRLVPIASGLFFSKLQIDYKLNIDFENQSAYIINTHFCPYGDFCTVLSILSAAWREGECFV